MVIVLIVKLLDAITILEKNFGEHSIQFLAQIEIVNSYYELEFKIPLSQYNW